MTVAALIAELEKYPKDTIVRVYNKHVESSMRPDRVLYFPPGDDDLESSVTISTYLCD